MVIDEREVWARVGEVIDPELDRPLDALGFVDQVVVHGAEVEVRLRLPTYWCAPNFAYMMVADLRDRVSQVAGVERVTVRLEDHFAGEEISAGVSQRRAFSEVFPGDAEGELDELRRTFAVKAFLVRQEQMLRSLLRAHISAERLTALTLADLVVEGDDVRVRAMPDHPPEGDGEWMRIRGLARTYRLWRSKRHALGIDEQPPGAPCFITAEGEPVAPDALQEHLRSARMIRLNGVFNTMLCTGLHGIRYGGGAPVEELTSEMA